MYTVYRGSGAEGMQRRVCNISTVQPGNMQAGGTPCKTANYLIPIYGSAWGGIMLTKIVEAKKIFQNFAHSDPNFGKHQNASLILNSR